MDERVTGCDPPQYLRKAHNFLLKVLKCPHIFFKGINRILTINTLNFLSKYFSYFRALPVIARYVKSEYETLDYCMAIGVICDEQ